MENYIKKNNLPYKLVNAESNLFEEVFDWSKEDFNKFWFSTIDEELEKIECKPFAKETIKNLRNKGHKIFIITARNSIWHKDPYKLSYDWLIKNEIEFDKLIIGQEEKVSSCLENKIDIFIDDHEKHIASLNDVGIKTILFKNIHNIIVFVFFPINNTKYG